MSDTKSDQDQAIICHCSGTTKETINILIDKKINDLDEISRRTGAISGCGACEMLIVELIAENR